MDFIGVKTIDDLLKFAESGTQNDFTKHDTYEEALSEMDNFLSQQNLIRNWTWEDIENYEYGKKLITEGYGHIATVSQNREGRGLVVWAGKYIFNEQWNQYLNGIFNPEEIFGDAIFYHGSPSADIIEESGFALVEDKSWINLTNNFNYALRWANNNKFNVLHCTVSVANPMPEDLWFSLHTKLQEEGYLGPDGKDYDNLINEGVKRAKELGYDSTYVGNELGVFDPENINVVGRGKVE